MVDTSLDKIKDVIEKQNIIQILFGYLSTTAPVRMFLHLIWITCVCMILSCAYVISFHFTSLLHIYQEAHNIKNFNTNLVASTRQDMQVNDALTSLLGVTDANRAYVFRYHNGLAAVSGVPFFFQTNTHEVIKPGTSRVVMFEQHIPASINMAVSNQLMQNRCAFIQKADEDKDSQNYWYFQNRGAKSVIRCPIFMSNGDVFGFVGIDYADRQDSKRFEYLSEHLKTTANTIAQIFAPGK
jgi:hypothetical protein